MKFKDIQATEYLLNVIEEYLAVKVGNQFERNNYELVIRRNNELIQFNSYELDYYSRPSTSYILKNLQESVISADIHDSNSTDLFKVIRYRWFKEYDRPFTFSDIYDFYNKPALFLKWIINFVSETDYSKSADFGATAFNVRYLESNVTLPFEIFSDEDNFEIVSLISKN